MPVCPTGWKPVLHHSIVSKNARQLLIMFREHLNPPWPWLHAGLHRILIESWNIIRLAEFSTFRGQEVSERLVESGWKRQSG
jgi:hypothetical protein